MGDLYTDMYDKNYEITGDMYSETERAVFEGAENIKICSQSINLQDLAFLLQCGYKPIIQCLKNKYTVYFTR